MQEKLLNKTVSDQGRQRRKADLTSGDVLTTTKSIERRSTAGDQSAAFRTSQRAASEQAVWLTITVSNSW